MRREGLLIMSTVLLLAAFVTLPAQAQTYDVLFNFDNQDGSFPNFGTLVRDKAGNLYGTTEFGGNADCGVVFKVTKNGTEEVLYSFECGLDGGNPGAGLLLSGRTLYGTTYVGGMGSGVLFAVDIKTDAETVLHAFTGGGDGARPSSALVQDELGNLYGTTEEGGSSNYGTVYKLVPSTKKETVLHSFTGSDGETPESGLTLDASGGVLYGTTFYGGSSGSPGYGVAFRVTIKTRAYAVLYNFTGSTDGAYPLGTLSNGPEGILYGTTVYGGSGTGENGHGVVFKLVPKTGKESVLYTFKGEPDAGVPVGGVIPGKAGKLFGTTQAGGTSNLGTIYEVDPKKGTDTVLLRFNEADGAYPLDGLAQNAKGTFYGTADGGTDGAGVVFSIHP